MQQARSDNRERRRSVKLIAAIVVIFALMGGAIWGIATKTYDDMSKAAISSLNENLNLMKGTIEAIFRSEADFQQVTAEELAEVEDPMAAVASMPNGETTSLVSLVPEGATEGVSNDGRPFDPAQLDFSGGGSVPGMELSQSYVNGMGTWAYTMACPVERDGRKTATLYMEYSFDTIDQALPSSFYGDQAVLYVMDVANERFVLKPEGMGARDAGHVNLEDFYRANAIGSPDILKMVEDGVAERRNVMFAHKVQGRESLCFLWSVNGGTTYLVGFVPMEAIQQEAQAVNIALVLVASVTALAFCLCVALFAFNQHRQTLALRAREAERSQHAEQLSQALQAAQLANESKSVFLANMSHDIRTPMNAVLGFAAIIGREADNPSRVRDCADKIMASGRHLLDLINDVLDISKIESGKATLRLEEFDLGDLLAAIESIISPMAADKGQAFHTEISAIRHERLVGDETHLNQILINLLSNAVKYTPAGGDVWLRFVGLPQRSEHRERIRIEVEDNGYGMTPEFLATIFDPFTRAENSTTNKIQGTGLGMSITKNLIDLMGGTIQVESEEGAGTLFKVELELRIPEEQALGSFWAQAGIERMLVVDPAGTCARTVQGFMEGTGVEVGAAATLGEARDALSARACQLVLWRCQSVDAEAADAAGELAGQADAVLLLPEQGAGHGSGQDGRQESLALPPNGGVLGWPFFPSTLKAKVADILDLGDDDASPVGNVLEGKHFLAAEDNVFNATILEDLLQLEGATVEVVENGQLAVERFERCEPGEFDAILMDVQMPVMNGHEATRAIRALPRQDARTMPIFAMTADAFSEDEQAALTAGMDVHLTKPIEIDDLKKAVDRFVGRAHEVQ